MHWFAYRVKWPQERTRYAQDRERRVLDQSIKGTWGIQKWKESPRKRIWESLFQGLSVRWRKVEATYQGWKETSWSQWLPAWEGLNSNSLERQRSDHWQLSEADNLAQEWSKPRWTWKVRAIEEAPRWDKRCLSKREKGKEQTLKGSWAADQVARGGWRVQEKRTTQRLEWGREDFKRVPHCTRGEKDDESEANRVLARVWTDEGQDW